MAAIGAVRTGAQRGPGTTLAPVSVTSTGQPRTGVGVAKVVVPKLKDLIQSLASIDTIDSIQLGGIDATNLIKLQSLIDGGRDFTKPTREMELTIARFLGALFAKNPTPSMAQIDSAIEEAIIGIIALRLRTGGGDVKSTFKPLSPEYAAYKRKKYPNSKGIGWATGELAHEWADGGNVRVVRK